MINGRRKYSIACYILAASTVMVFCKYLTGSEWVTVATLVIGIYGAANIGDKRLNGVAGNG